MSDGSLSQDEIDALLQGTGGSEADLGGAVPEDAGSAGPFSPQEMQAFKTLVSGYKDAQASNLSGIMVGKTVTIGDPEISFVTPDDVAATFSGDVVEVSLDFTEGLEGSHSYVMDNESASVLAANVVGQEQVELNDMALEALKEAFSTITGVALTSIGDTIGTTVMPSSGESTQTEPAALKIDEEGAVQAAYDVQIEDEIPCRIYEYFGYSGAREIISNLGVSPEPDLGMDLGSLNPEPVQNQNSGGPVPQDTGNQQMGGGGMQGFVPQPPGGGMQGMGFGQSTPNVQPVQFPNLAPSAGPQDAGNISLLMDVYMEMTVELGRTKKPIREILGMGEGTIIELDKLAGEPVDILVNHKLIATGEVVVIDENFGVRVTEIVSPSERMKEIT